MVTEGSVLRRQSSVTLLSNPNCYQEQLRRDRITGISWEDKKLHFHAINFEV